MYKLLFFIFTMVLFACSNNNNTSTPINNTNEIHKAYKADNAKPIIWIGDFNNFDDAIALMLIAKDPNYYIDLIVVEDSFNTIAHGANIAYNILEWLGNLDTYIIRGAYFALDEVILGANGANADNTAVNDEYAVTGQADYQLPNSSNSDTGIWNLERRNVMGINIYGQYVPGPWRDNGSTLYGTDYLIPQATQEHYHYQGNSGVSFNFKLAEEIIFARLEALGQNVIILNTGKLTTLARVLAKGSDTQLAKIASVLLMGGGFQGFTPFIAENTACLGDKSSNLGGNIFSHPSFGCDSDFSTHQEFNILLDPLSAQNAFNLLAEKNIATMIVPTNGTDDAKVHLATIDDLSAPGATPEACYTARLLAAIRAFEGGDNEGDFALDAVIRLWDIVAALVLLEPDLITATKTDSYIAVDQLDAGLATSTTPYDPITFDPKVGKTTFTELGTGSKPTVVLAIDVDVARQTMIDRLRDSKNAAKIDVACE